MQRGARLRHPSRVRMTDPMRGGMRQFLTFGLVGVINTSIGLGTIALAQEGLGLHPVLSNIVGYAAGLTNSYFMNRAFTFRGAAHSQGAVVRFLVAFALAYGANLIVLLALLGRSEDHAMFWQAAGMVVYTVVFFLVSKFYVFRDAA